MPEDVSPAGEDLVRMRCGLFLASIFSTSRLDTFFEVGQTLERAVLLAILNDRRGLRASESEAAFQFDRRR